MTCAEFSAAGAQGQDGPVGGGGMSWAGGQNTDHVRVGWSGRFQVWLRWEVVWDLVRVCFLRSGDLGQKQEHHLPVTSVVLRIKGSLGRVGQGLWKFVCRGKSLWCGPCGPGCGAHRGCGCVPGKRCVQKQSASRICSLLPPHLGEVI